MILKSIEIGLRSRNKLNTTMLLFGNRLLFFIIYLIAPLVQNDCDHPLNFALALGWFILTTTLPFVWNWHRVCKNQNYNFFFGCTIVSLLWGIGMWARLLFGGMNYMEANIGPAFCLSTIHQSLYPMFPLHTWYGWEMNWGIGVLLTVGPAFLESMETFLLWSLLLLISYGSITAAHQFLTLYEWVATVVFSYQYMISLIYN